MDWNPAYTWLVIALLLSLGELTSGAMVLLALGIAAALTAAVTALSAAHGAWGVRVHDVRSSADAVRVGAAWRVAAAGATGGGVA